MRSTTEYLLLWEDRINERSRNGMTIEEWCKKNGNTKQSHLCGGFSVFYISSHDFYI